MSETKTLEMVFNLDNGKEMTISLTSPKNDLDAETVSDVMSTMVAKSAILYNGAELAGAKSAFTKAVTKEILF